jgi:hypothetical protein
MKKEAEDFLTTQENLYGAVLRPGLVYHESERPAVMPLGLLSNIAHTVTSMTSTGKTVPPGTDLRVLA